jgi:glutamine amidotransferase
MHYRKKGVPVCAGPVNNKCPEYRCYYMSGTIAVINYGAGNLGSVVNAVNALGYVPTVTDRPSEVLSADAVILPGVGAAGDTMDSLQASGMVDVVRHLVDDDRPLFAICVGLQILLTGTYEGGWHDCLGIIPGTVKKLPGGMKIPHMGWNQVKQTQPHRIFDGIPDEVNFYFVHSYYPDPEDSSVVAGITDYGLSFCSMAIRGNLFATQFHPEKSGEHGLKMYDNFFNMALGK